MRMSDLVVKAVLRSMVVDNIITEEEFEEMYKNYIKHRNKLSK